MLGDDVVFVKPGDPQALATAIEALTSDPDYLAQKQRDARTAAERFTSDEITRDLAQWITESAGMAWCISVRNARYELTFASRCEASWAEK